VLERAELVAFVGTRDLRLSDRFYGGLLGLALVDSGPYANVYDTGGAPLRVTLVEDVARAPYTVLGWNVPDIASAIESLAARGVGFTRYEGLEQDAVGIWTAPGGARVAWFQDPDGNTLSLSQPRS
jgi:catechol 2,3-dioxygenase-like lactoylglutathione lyase family enzyme